MTPNGCLFKHCLKKPYYIIGGGGGGGCILQRIHENMKYTHAWSHQMGSTKYNIH